MRKVRNLRLCFLVSGSGTTMEAIFREIEKGRILGVEPTLVIASKPGIPAIGRALASGMKPKDIIFLSPKNFPSEETFGQAILQNCISRGVNMIGQYGWLPHTPSNVVNAFRGKITNQHPAPLDPGYPDFGGTSMHGLAAVAARYRFATLVGNQAMWTEATVHHVVDEVDKGKLIAVTRLAILPNDTPKTLQTRLLPIEWELQIEMLRALTRFKTPSFARRERLIPPDTAHLLDEAKRWGIEYAKNH